jgi:branched-chain amino acid transport system ATP-binding protein
VNALLEVEGLHAGYGHVRVLHDLAFSAGVGEIVAILGPNGAGKTTTLRAISGEIRPRGRVRFDGADIAGRPPEALVKLGVAHVPEGRGTFTGFSVEENLLLGGYTLGRGELRARVEHCWSLFPELRDRRTQRAASLSGGEQQMLAIARALMRPPRLLLLDEPSLGLAPLVTRRVFEVLRRIREEDGATLVIVEQNANLVLDFADRAYVLESGRISLSGSAAEMRERDDVRRSYLGY